MTYAQLGEKSIDCSHLNPSSSADVPQLGSCHVIFAIGLKQRKRCKALNDLVASLGARKSLKQFLKDQTRCHYDVCPQKRVREGLSFGRRGQGVTSQRERPYARIDKEGHFRDRSAL